MAGSKTNLRRVWAAALPQPKPDEEMGGSMYGKIRITMFILALLLTSCQGGQLALFGPTPTPFPEEFEGNAKIGDYEMKISCVGSGEPTVVLERGAWGDYGLDLSDSNRFAEISRTCFYKRPGMDTGNHFTEPRTASDQVKDLHALLAQTGVPGPYILVGYHLARYNLILYADQYPRDVAGLITLSGWYPTQYDYTLEKLGPVTADTPEKVKARIDFYTDYKAGKILTWKTHPEFLNQVASEAQVLKVTSLKDIPLTILLESDYKYFIFDDETMSDETCKINMEAIRQSNEDFCKLSSKCQMLTVPGTDYLNLPRNQAVEDAIQEMVDGARGE